MYGIKTNMAMATFMFMKWVHGNASDEIFADKISPKL